MERQTITHAIPALVCSVHSWRSNVCWAVILVAQGPIPLLHNIAPSCIGIVSLTDICLSAGPKDPGVLVLLLHLHQTTDHPLSFIVVSESCHKSYC